MIETFYLIVRKGGVDRITKRFPVLRQVERAIKVRLKVEDAVWNNLIPEVSITVAAVETFIQPPELEIVSSEEEHSDPQV